MLLHRTWQTQQMRQSSTHRLRCLSAHPRPARKKKRRRLLRSSAIDEDAAGEADVVVSGTDAVVRDAADAGEGAVLRQDDLVIAEEDLSFDDRIEERPLAASLVSLNSRFDASFLPDDRRPEITRYHRRDGSIDGHSRDEELELRQLPQSRQQQQLLPQPLTPISSTSSTPPPSSKPPPPPHSPDAGASEDTPAPTSKFHASDTWPQLSFRDLLERGSKFIDASSASDAASNSSTANLLSRSETNSQNGEDPNRCFCENCSPVSTTLRAAVDVLETSV